ncbi:MAG: ribonuclease III [Pedosphaera sp.]|nr:ribonuclease III [Pedosphaera sp.]
MQWQASFQKRLGYTFRRPELLVLALTHPSACAEQQGPAQSNQRLEFLGDAVLQLVLSSELFRKFPGRDEGGLSKNRAWLVNGETLAAQGRVLRLGEILVLGRGEEKSGGRDRDSSLADAFEALLGAIYMDGGYTKARAVILRQFGEALHGADAGQFVGNPKGELQELVQAKSAAGPEYRLVDTVGPDHARVFVCAVRYQGEELARGNGKSKKAAEAAAAAAALEVLRGAKTGRGKKRSTPAAGHA